MHLFEHLEEHMKQQRANNARTLTFMQLQYWLEHPGCVPGQGRFAI